MKKIRAYGTPDKRRKKKDEEMVYICNNKPTEVVYVESYQASLKEDDKKESSWFIPPEKLKLLPLLPWKVGNFVVDVILSITIFWLFSKR